jgi:hypothetical protein
LAEKKPHVESRVGIGGDHAIALRAHHKERCRWEDRLLQERYQRMEAGWVILPDIRRSPDDQVEQ